jgi:hypothetical protein
MMKRILVLGALAMVFTASTADAQRSSRRDGGQIELGIDGGITFGLDDPSFTLVELPVQVFRVGYFLNDRFEIEPQISIISASGGGGGSATVYRLGAGLLWQPSGDRVGKGLYFRPFVGVTGFSVSGPGDENAAEAGIGVGVKLPFNDRRLATRLEANYSRVDDANQIRLMFGLSWFTR